LPAPAREGVPPSGACSGCGIRLAGRAGTDGKGEGGSRGAGAGNGKGDTGKVRGRGWRSPVRRRQSRSKARDRPARGARAGKRQIHATVRGSRTARGGARPGRRTGKPGGAGSVVGRNKGDEMTSIAFVVTATAYTTSSETRSLPGCVGYPRSTPPCALRRGQPPRARTCRTAGDRDTSYTRPPGVSPRGSAKAACRSRPR